MLLVKLAYSRRHFSPLRGSPAGWLSGLPTVGRFRIPAAQLRIICKSYIGKRISNAFAFVITAEWVAEMDAIAADGSPAVVAAAEGALRAVQQWVPVCIWARTWGVR